MKAGMEASHLSFDCYGTLIDWERGILAAVQPLLVRLGVHAAPEAILKSYVRHEAYWEGQAWMPYREVLRGVMRGLAADFGVVLPAGTTDTLARALPSWKPFPDTVAALHALAKRFQLVILSNIDDELFAGTNRQLGVRFSEVVTAEQVRSYKPGPVHFQEAVRRLGVPIGQIVHVAQSLHHDHAPARALGFRSVWIKRPSLLRETGLTPVSAPAEPDLVFPDLASFAAWLD